MPNSFTPGPWNIYFNSQDNFVIRKMFADGQESHVVARCHSGAANARLIASAPDLLEALAGMIEQFGYGVVPHRVLTHDEHAAITTAMRAIKKAEGNLDEPN